MSKQIPGWIQSFREEWNELLERQAQSAPYHPLDDYGILDILQYLLDNVEDEVIGANLLNDVPPEVSNPIDMDVHMGSFRHHIESAMFHFNLMMEEEMN